MFPLNDQPPEKPDFRDDGSLDVHSVFYTIQGEGPFAGRPAVFLRLAGCNLQCPDCFHANTVIRMADFSTKLISEVKVGDKVLSYDEASGKFVKRKVTSVMSKQVRTIYGVKTESNKTTYVTGEHPFLVRDKGWVKVKDLKEGDKILHLSLSELRRMHNPMKDREVVQRMISTTNANGGFSSPTEKMSKSERKAHYRKTSRRMTRSNPMKDPEVAVRGFLSRKDRGNKTRVEEYVERIGKPFGLKFTGSGDLVVGNKIPDFVIDGTRKLVETWDATQTEYRGRDAKWEADRRKVFEESGYEVLFLPTTPSKANEVIVRNALAQYARNGSVVKSVKEVNPKAWARLAGSMHAFLTVYNLEVEGTHTYIADSMVVHNCDTEYTDKRERWSVDKVIHNVLVAWPLERSPLVVITGGEPFRQNINPLVRLMCERNCQVQVESNGTMFTNTYDNLFPVYSAKIVVSPKAGKIKDSLADHVCALKYVLEDGKVDPADGLPTSVLGNGVRPCRPWPGFKGEVYVQPSDMKDPLLNAANRRVTAESAMKFGYRLGVQMHKDYNLE